MPGELLVSRLGNQTWAVLRENGATVEVRVERDGDPLPVGLILKARVSRVLPGIQSAFLKVGFGRDAFLHGADLVLPGEIASISEPPPTVLDANGVEDDLDVAAEAPISSPAARSRRATRFPPIEQRITEGTELLVQVVKESIGSKGARVSSFISLPGRYLVYMPHTDYRGVSRRITDPEERARLRTLLAALPAPSGGFIARTAGRGAAEEDYRADAARLSLLWSRISARAAEATAPALLHGDVDLLRRLLRDAPSDGLDRVVVDSKDAFARAQEYLSELDPQLASRLVLHSGPASLFEAYGVDREIERSLRPKVWLRSGGYIVIQQTEALLSIDVNSGKFVGRHDPEETALRINLEAASEIARQLRIRDLGGIIVVDFIDMENPESWRRVTAALEAALLGDRSRTKIVGLSELGLLQLTRKRTRLGIEGALTRPCPLCAGNGRLKSAETVASEALAEVRRLRQEVPGKTLTVRAHPDVARALLLAVQGDGSPQDVDLRIEEDGSGRPDQFDLIAV